MERRILVLGSNSFSGSDFVDLLLNDEKNIVFGVSRSPEKGPLFLPYRRRTRGQFSFQQIDLNTQMNDLFAVVKSFRPRYIVNFAAQSEVAPSWDSPEHWFETNTVALAKLANFLRQIDCLERYVHISSPEVYGTCTGTVDESAPLNPSTPYAASKAAADLFLFTLFKNYQFPLVVVRSTNVYGARQQLFKIIPRTFIYLMQGKKIQLHGGGNAVKSYIHIRDISQGELAAMEQGRPGQIYHFSPDQGISVRDVVKKICEIQQVDFAKMVETVEERLGQDAAYVIDSGKARRELGWKSMTTIDAGLAEVKEWVSQNWDEIKKEPLEYVHRP